ncbi:MAG: hypothetical protein PWQ65_810 [Bacteroidota bacterium]|nr:hypothetical protein [Rikenellaceae bacterium]MDK2969703.1 hypothetical protein [Bacteroidota bacterium]MDN5355396.1 hypothetical protein [Rikenellaceae bacterium]
MKEAQSGEVIIYQSEEDKTKIEVRLENDNVWLTQKMMAELFQTSPQNIMLHLKNIFKKCELQEDTTCKDFLQVQTKGSLKDEKLLSDAGSVSHRQAIDKAKDEFRKYRLKTLSPVEKAYLENIKAVQKKIEKRKKENEQN